MVELDRTQWRVVWGWKNIPFSMALVLAVSLFCLWRHPARWDAPETWWFLGIALAVSVPVGLLAWWQECRLLRYEQAWRDAEAAEERSESIRSLIRPMRHRRAFPRSRGYRKIPWDRRSMTGASHRE